MRTITVTQLDIDAGQRFSASGDPIALALNRVFDEEIGVGLNTWWKVGSRIEYLLPIEARTFRSLFDSNKPVIPFLFSINEDEDDEYEMVGCFGKRVGPFDSSGFPLSSESKDAS